ncbi:MAG: hypothetical protein HRU32_13690, partial [Rhodobacteraceae bacterium]|nr:hypothetical protein [Paracoccaceae bacterium]
MKSWVAIVAVIWAAPVFAQNAQGSGDIGRWTSLHYEAFGLWEAACDQRTTSERLETRCYVRVIDPVAYRPNYNALTLFVVEGDNGPFVELGLPERTSFGPDGIVVTKDGALIWSMDGARCETVDLCLLEPSEREGLLAAVAEGETLSFAFTDGTGEALMRSWPLEDARAALA